jgi:hypothetical protein
MRQATLFNNPKNFRQSSSSTAENTPQQANAIKQYPFIGSGGDSARCNKTVFVPIMVLCTGCPFPCVRGPGWLRACVAEHG